jgi:hypothetical protein
MGDGCWVTGSQGVRVSGRTTNLPPRHPDTTSAASNHPSPSLRNRLFLSRRRVPGRGDRCEPQQRYRVVVGGNPGLAHDTAAVAAMGHHLLSVRSIRNSHGCHQRATGTRAIPRATQIDMAGCQAQWTVIAVPAARDGRPHEGAATAAFEWIPFVAPGPRAEWDILPRSPRSRPGLASERISPHRR